ncbi:MAG: methyltransferase domain-containing protein [Deltaproteobacteria bacterium]|nr:methyltransferase domain-containing protein [Deltaproteobacteria bacterium]
MPTLDDLRSTVMSAAQGAMTLQLAYIGVTNDLFESLARDGSASADELAARAGVDAGYVRRFCDAAYAFGLLDARDDRFELTDLGHAFRPSTRGTLMPFAVQAVLGAHMAERAAGLMKTGERPGESVLAERATVLPWFGPMLEASFAGLFEREIVPWLEVYRDLEARGGVAVDLGCGNGWYLRKLVARYPHVRGVGLDGFEENVRHAQAEAERAGLADRLSFRTGDIHHFTVDEPVSLVAMNRALHHVWDRREKVFSTLRDAVVPGGAVVIWEPSWPEDRASLRDPRRRGMAFQNLSEHVQGNHFLRPAEIEEAMRSVGLTPRTHLFAEGAEAVVVGTKA